MEEPGRGKILIRPTVLSRCVEPGAAHLTATPCRSSSSRPRWQLETRPSSRNWCCTHVLMSELALIAAAESADEPAAIRRKHAWSATRRASRWQHWIHTLCGELVVSNITLLTRGQSRVVGAQTSPIDAHTMWKGEGSGVRSGQWTLTLCGEGRTCRSDITIQTTHKVAWTGRYVSSTDEL